MKVEPWIDGHGRPHRREQVPYIAGAFWDERADQWIVALTDTRDRDELSCLKDVGVFSLRLRKGTTDEEAAALADAMNANMHAWEAIFSDDAGGGGDSLEGLRPISEIMEQRPTAPGLH